MGCDDKDLIRPLGPLPDGSTLVQRHRPDHSTGVATVCPVPSGTPMAAGEEFVMTRRRDDGSYEIVDSYVHGAPAGGKPAQVATDAFRNGWERTFNAPGGQA